MALDPKLQSRIQSLIDSNPVVLFIKGDRNQPQCGFSATVVGILDGLIPDYVTVNVLADPEIREGIKAFASWPTIPQLYVRGEFIGGCDIVKELSASGEIFDVLNIQKPATQKPQITLTKAAVEAFKNALEDADGLLRLEVSANFESALSFSEKKPNDFEIQQEEILILIDPISASRANGLTIDFSTTSQGKGFQIDNPNAPPKVKSMSPQELLQKQERREPFHLFDVRTREEWNEGRIPFARLLLDVPQTELSALDKNAPIVFQCHAGGRSQRMAEQFRQKGFRNVFNLVGGIQAWSSEALPLQK